MKYFDDLPVEIKEQIIFNADYEPIMRVSEEWRKIIYNSKRLLQQELDKFSFFFIVWYFKSKRPKTKDAERSRLFVFPISTEEEFRFLSQYETDRSQVGALEKSKDLTSLFQGRGMTYFYKHKGAIGNTKHLIRSIQDLGRKGVFNYIQNLRNFPHRPYGDYLRDPKRIEGPRFTNKQHMMNLLKGEHYVTDVLNDSRHFYIHPRNYDKVINITKKLKQKFETKLQDAQENIRELVDSARVYDERVVENVRQAKELEDRSWTVSASWAWNEAREEKTLADQIRNQLQRVKSDSDRLVDVLRTIETAIPIRSLFKPRWLTSAEAVELTPANYKKKLLEK